MIKYIDTLVKGENYLETQREKVSAYGTKIAHIITKMENKDKIISIHKICKFIDKNTKFLAVSKNIIYQIMGNSSMQTETVLKILVKNFQA